MTHRRQFMLSAAALAVAATLPFAAQAADAAKIGFVYVSPIGDAGWTYQHDEGRKELEKALGSRIETRYVENVAEGADAERVIREFAASGSKLIMKKYIHIGVAVDTPGGLVVPVVRDVNKKGIHELSRDLAEISKKARAGKLTAADMQGGCFTISSLGGIGGTSFTPIVNAPEVAILGVSKSEMKPKWNGKEFVPRLMLPLALSYDHRVIDGADGARFITTLSGVLSDIRRLVL